MSSTDSSLTPIPRSVSPRTRRMTGTLTSSRSNTRQNRTLGRVIRSVLTTARFPTTRRRNQTHRYVSAGSLRGMQREFLDHRIGQQFPGQFPDGGERLGVGRPVKLKLKTLSLAHARHRAEAEPA